MEISSINRLNSSDFQIISDFSDTYTDEDFKPDITSLINFDANTLTNDKKLFWTTLEWKRISHIFGSPLSLIDNVSYKDPIQGSIGNCYLMSVCSAIAEYPNRLKKIFVKPDINKAGIYAIRFYINGINTIVTIDDFIPVNPYSDIPVFTQLPKSRNIWPIVIEKAWAKQLKNYQNTISGDPAALFRILTGAPSEKFYSSNIVTEQEIDHFWKKFKNFYYCNYFICASTSEIIDIETIGLVKNHAYTILFFEEFVHKEMPMKMVKLRNPWGVLNNKNNKNRIENLQQSHLENEEVKQNIGKQEEGAFVLKFEEFLQFFSTTYVCKYIDNYKNYGYILKINPLKNEHFICINVDLKHAKNLKEKIFFTVSQPTALNFLKGDDKSKKNMIYSSIFLAKRDIIDDTLKFITFASGNFSSTIELESYEAAEYVILVHVDKYEGSLIKIKNNIGYLSIYSSETEISMQEELNIDSKWIFNKIIYDYYNNLRNSLDKKLKLLSEDGLLSMNSFVLADSPYNIILFENLSNNILWYSLDNVEFKEYDKGGIINEPKKKYYEGDLEYKQYFILATFNTSISYQYRWIIKYNRETLKNQVIKEGEFYGFTFKNSVILIKIFQHQNGIVYYVKNNHSDMVNLVINFTVDNLICDEIPKNIIDLFAESGGEYVYFFEKIDNMKKHRIQWKSRLNELS